MGKTKALVTGGSGFVGQHVVQQLLDTGKYTVTIFDIREGAIKSPDLSTVTGDLRKPEDVEAACKGIDVVFHVATASPTGTNALNLELMDGVNVQGTKNVVAACQAAGVKKLVYTSSASVVFEGKNLHLVTEAHPYAAKPMDYYTKTKIVGEEVVLEANGKGGLATCALRPSGIFGEGDMLAVPSIVKNARAGKMKYIIGDGKNEMDWTYVGNVAQAHLQAADALELGSPVAGSAYFITNQDPLPFWGMMGNLCEGLGYSRPSVKLPFGLVISIAFVFEYVIRPLVSAFKKLESDFTVNRILISTTNRTFDSRKATRDFGYVPKVNMADAIDRTVKAFAHLRNPAENADKAKAQ